MHDGGEGIHSRRSDRTQGYMWGGIPVRWASLHHDIPCTKFVSLIRLEADRPRSALLAAIVIKRKSVRTSNAQCMRLQTRHRTHIIILSRGGQNISAGKWPFGEEGPRNARRPTWPAAAAHARCSGRYAITGSCPRGDSGPHATSEPARSVRHSFAVDLLSTTFGIIFVRLRSPGVMELQDFFFFTEVLWIGVGGFRRRSLHYDDPGGNASQPDAAPAQTHCSVLMGYRPGFRGVSQ